jgi:hypothetical protein
MADLFSGDPQTATSYTTSSTETPKWMQDAIYNQINWATNVANTGYTPYSLPTIADLSNRTKTAYSNMEANQGAWKPDMTTAATGMKTLTNAPGALDVANPYLTKAGASAVDNIGQYMNPYQQGVLDVIAQQGARNLSENLLPNVSDAFIKAGQFGGTRMGEFGARALRDTQEAILAQQAKAAQEGYTQALGASQTDLARQGTLASTVGNLATSDTAAKRAALTSLADMATTSAGMSATDAAALEAAGNAEQTNQQAKLTAAQQQWLEEQNYPKQQLDWLNTQIRGMAPITPQATTSSGTTTGATYSPSVLSQLASAYSMYKGLTPPK